VAELGGLRDRTRQRHLCTAAHGASTGYHAPPPTISHYSLVLPRRDVAFLFQNPIRPQPAHNGQEQQESEWLLVKGRWVPLPPPATTPAFLLLARRPTGKYSPTTTSSQSPRTTATWTTTILSVEKAKELLTDIYGGITKFLTKFLTEVREEIRQAKEEIDANCAKGVGATLGLKNDNKRGEYEKDRRSRSHGWPAPSPTANPCPPVAPRLGRWRWPHQPRQQTPRATQSAPPAPGQAESEGRSSLSTGHFEEAKGGEARVAAPDVDAFQTRDWSATRARARARTRSPTGLYRRRSKSRRKGIGKRAGPPWSASDAEAGPRW